MQVLISCLTRDLTGKPLFPGVLQPAQSSHGWTEEKRQEEQKQENQSHPMSNRLLNVTVGTRPGLCCLREWPKRKKKGLVAAPLGSFTPRPPPNTVHPPSDSFDIMPLFAWSTLTPGCSVPSVKWNRSCGRSRSSVDSPAATPPEPTARTSVIGCPLFNLSLYNAVSRVPPCLETILSREE